MRNLPGFPRCRSRMAWGGLAALLMLCACGEKPPRQTTNPTAVRVNGEEIKVAQINLLLQQQRGLQPNQVDAVGRALLERLIDQALAVQQAEKLGLDRDAKVQMQMDTARREVLARAWRDHLLAQLPPPSAEDIQRYYDAHPERFAQRKRFTVEEILVEAPPSQWASLQQRLANPQPLAELVQALQAEGLKVTTASSVRSSEQLPAGMLSALGGLREGQAVTMVSTAGVTALLKRAEEAQPLALAQAQPLIEAQLQAERQHKAFEAAGKGLRAQAKLEYVGAFVPGGVAAAPPSATAASDAVVPTAPVSSAPAPPAAPESAPPRAAPVAAPSAAAAASR